MTILEAQKFSIATNSAGELGFITSDSKISTMIGHRWIGLHINDDNEVTKHEWHSRFPTILFTIDPAIVYAGYQDDINKENIERYLKFYVKIEKLKKEFNKKTDLILNNVFPLFMNLDLKSNPTLEDFTKLIDDSLVRNYGTHGTHCCAEHGCKYGNIDCPVVSCVMTQNYKCEECSGSHWDTTHFQNEIATLGDNAFLRHLKNDSALLLALNEMKKRNIHADDIL